MRLFLGGPFLVFLVTGCLAVVALSAALAGRLESLTRLGTRAAARFETSRIIPALWGLAAGLLLFLLAAVLFNSHTFALLGFLVLAISLALAGLGLAVASLSVGTRLSDTLAPLETEILGNLRLGLWSLTLSSAVPFAGWLLVLLLLASGIGAVLEVLSVRKVTDSDSND